MTPHAVVTGAAEGIGRALVEVLGAHAYSVTGIDVNAEVAARTQEELVNRGIDLGFLLGDLSQMADLDRLARRLIEGPAIDVLVHNAGINCVGAFADSDLGKQQTVLDVNLHAPLHLTAALLRANKVVQGGTLIFVSSLSRFVSYPGAAVYGAGKDGLASYARSLAVALAPQDINVLVVYPGPTRTAHARRYSPDNRHEGRRMPPDVLAAAIYRALVKRRRTLIPGIGNQLFAFAGRWMPAPVEWVMQQTLFKKL
ncbi:MAG: SDR family NAD(P)-dependent oxidoreductase [Anaerolineales bacterium]|nr:SDR family NAD(P)-dependent oxidoreductase [Anaerolineales bacterium]